jgi:L-fuconolactonase
MLTIDSHHHVWELGTAPYAWINGPAWSTIRKNFFYDDLRTDLLTCGIRKSILVQADNTKSDSDYVKTVAAKEDMVCGFVGWVPLTQPETIDAGSRSISIEIVQPISGTCRFLLSVSPTCG